MNQIIAENLSDSISTISTHESQFNEGDDGELRIFLEESMPQSDVIMLEQSIISQRVVLIKPITQDARMLVINFQKRIAPLDIINEKISELKVGILGWQLFRKVAAVPTWVWWAGGGILLFLAGRQLTRR